MAPTHKKSGSDPDFKRGRRILGCFGFGSKMIRKDSAKADEKAVPFKVVQLSDDNDHIHHHPLPVSPEKFQEKSGGVGKLMKQFGQVSKFEGESTLDGSKSNQMKESKSQKSCRKLRRKRSGSSTHKLEGEAVAAMSILMVILIIMLICGRLCAIICASICFYCLPCFVKTTSNKNDKEKNKSNLNDEKHEISEFDSAAYRRKVVLEGILARKSNMDLLAAAPTYVV